MTNREFWDIVQNDPAFHARFHGCAHPLQESNGGLDFHNPENLQNLLQRAQHDYETMPKAGMSAWARKNRVAVIRDWLVQAEWVCENSSTA